MKVFLLKLFSLVLFVHDDFSIKTDIACLKLADAKLRPSVIEIESSYYLVQSPMIDFDACNMTNDETIYLLVVKPP